MRASVGDQLVQHGRVVGQHDKVGEIVEVLGQEGNPPYRVKFEDGHEGLCSPGPDTEIRHRSTQPSTSGQSPMSGRSPMTGQSPTTGQSPVTGQSPTTGRPPMTGQPPMTGRSPMTGQ